MSASNDMGDAPQGFEPITANVVMPCLNDIAKTALEESPLVALANHRQVHLNKETVKVKTQLASDNGGNVIADINAPVFNAANSPEYTEAANGDVDEIELVFNVTESSEEMSRVVQNISKTI